MAHRLSKIVTRTGDDGSTGLGDGSRVPKTSPRIDLLGEIDELNCHLGAALAAPLGDTLRTVLVRLQHELFDLGGEVCIPGRVAIDDAYVARAEADVLRFNGALSPLREFVLPGGTAAAAALHLARAVCRRAERSMWAMGREEALGPCAPRYLNRLSDLLFVLARVANRDAGMLDHCWQPGHIVP